jgi:hypothetical protein
MAISQARMRLKHRFDHGDTGRHRSRPDSSPEWRVLPPHHASRLLTTRPVVCPLIGQADLPGFGEAGVRRFPGNRRRLTSITGVVMRSDDECSTVAYPVQARYAPGDVWITGGCVQHTSGRG